MECKGEDHLQLNNNLLTSEAIQQQTQQPSCMGSHTHTPQPVYGRVAKHAP